MVVEYLGCIDLDLGSYPGWWAATVATYRPSRVVEHANQGALTRPLESPCTVMASEMA